ncbi:DUF362 domain-containing protein [Deferribacterales bacterium Es71-Z0220]|jgi:uncharacterized protein (DUF362 family)|uniref:DUF362 domain-containing protein n=1 Tax=Deferrivibrio essentukiensis TaxID=2880922 RepID=UPI001F600227|nr:DUF362 domain-containing protein [Deferrivibrio essentukiensis]MBZ4671934.1 hypothetical protein [Deferribacteraceae bacterium]MCB4204195.1 DUF362 domain-containing protein [Deferrivibrio essentukiensis]
MNKVYVKDINSYFDDELCAFIEKFFNDNKLIFNDIKTILLKPNILQASPPENGVTTHPEFIRAVIKALKKNGDFQILLGDSPGANFKNYEKVLEVTGIKKVCKDENIEIISIESYKPLNIDDMVISSVFENVDLIINLPKLKTHSLTGLTLAVKNLFGLIPGTNKVNYHRKNPVDTDLADSIFKIYDLVKDKTIHILDGIIAHEGDGPSRGTPVSLNLVAAATDAVSLDMAICDILDLDREICLTNCSAIKKGYNVNFKLTENVSKRKIKLPISKRMFSPPKFLKSMVAKNIYVKPEVNENCIGCLLCLKSCPVYAIKSTSNKRVIIDKSKCIECFCCHEVCESGAIDLKRSFLHRIIVND